ncbi:superoxide dismutase family protein [soil metagenome]
MRALASAALAAACLAMVVPASAAELNVNLTLVTEGGVGAAVGKVTISESPYGLVFTPQLSGLPPGLHGFHVHQNPSCDSGQQDGKTVPALAAGGHYDPEKTGRHGLPWGDGHLGDLPALMVTGDGNAIQPVLAPRFKTLDQVVGHALMVHVGGDNHADMPMPLGGGGARMACGVIR